MRPFLPILALLAAIVAPSTTIERLSMEQMIEKSTSIVRGKAVRAEGVRRGGIIYTDYTFQVAETLKGAPGASVALSVPGGRLGAARQSFAGTPSLEIGTEYVVFVWTSKSGVHHIIGLSQGLFTATADARGELVLRRGPATAAQVVDGSGKEIADQAVELTWTELVRRVRGAGVVR